MTTQKIEIHGTEKVSKIVCFGLEFQAALKAALAVAGDKEPFDVIQIRLKDDDMLRVCARDAAKDMIVAIDVNTSFVDVIADRDEVIEVSKSDARALSAMRMRKSEADEDEDPMVGLFIWPNAVLRTDETGLGLGIRQVRVRRATWPGEKTSLGDVSAMLEAAISSTPGKTVDLTHKQAKAFGTVASLLDTVLTLKPLEKTTDMDSRVLVGSRNLMLTGFASRPSDSPQESGKDDTKPGQEPENGELSFDDQDNVREINIVRADPAGGMA